MTWVSLWNQVSWGKTPEGWGWVSPLLGKEGRAGSSMQGEAGEGGTGIHTHRGSEGPATFGKSWLNPAEEAEEGSDWT